MNPQQGICEFVKVEAKIVQVYRVSIVSRWAKLSYDRFYKWLALFCNDFHPDTKCSSSLTVFLNGAPRTDEDCNSSGGCIAAVLKRLVLGENDAILLLGNISNLLK